MARARVQVGPVTVLGVCSRPGHDIPGTSLSSIMWVGVTVHNAELTMAATVASAGLLYRTRVVRNQSLHLQTVNNSATIKI